MPLYPSVYPTVILAAIALPMYSTFKQKGKVSGPVKACTGGQTAFQNWFDDNGSFANIDVTEPEGGALSDTVTGVRVGAGLPRIEDMLWTVTPGATTPTTAQIDISWDFTTNSCPDIPCDGKFCLLCNSDQDICVYAIATSDGRLGFDYNGGTPTVPITCTFP